VVDTPSPWSQSENSYAIQVCSKIVANPLHSKKNSAIVSPANSPPPVNSPSPGRELDICNAVLETNKKKVQYKKSAAAATKRAKKSQPKAKADRNGGRAERVCKGLIDYSVL
jgi:hypothetical protein